MSYPNSEEIAQFVKEDLGAGDVTAAIIPAETQATATVITREAMTVCGQQWFEAVIYHIDAQIVIDWQVEEGQKVDKDALLCKLTGSARHLLTAERTALNLLQTLAATASITRRYADAVKGTGCKILDTRKTLPGLRKAQKHAVKCGGGYNHRMGLFDAVLIKENHIIAAGSIDKAISIARQTSDVMIEVEVENLSEFQQALAAKPDRIMLDNFSREDMKTAVSINNSAVELEASGNITLATIRSIAETGVDYISVGALTKNVNAIDLSMRIQLNHE